MSYINPSPGGVIALSSGAMTVASGIVQIDINLANKSNGFADDYTIDVIDIGTLEVDYDFVEEVGDINDFKINVSEFEFELRDLAKNPNNFAQVDLVSAMINDLDTYDLIVVKLTFNNRSDYYFSTRSQTEFSYTDRRVKISGKNPLLYGVQPYGVTWTDSLIGKEINVRSVDSNQNTFLETQSHFLAKDIIQSYVKILSVNPIEVYSSNVYTQNASTYSTISSGDVDVIVSLVDAVDYAQATNFVKGAALCDCAIIGNILGYSFYVGRYSSEYSTLLGASDFLKLDVDYDFKNVRLFDIEIAYGNPGEIGNYNPFPLISVTKNINDLGRNDINVTFDTGLVGSRFGVAANEGGTVLLNYPDLNDPGEVGYNNIDFNTYKNTVVDSYTAMFRIGSGIKISGEIAGLESLLPYEIFKVSSGVHPLIDNKSFRPSYLKYNLKDDIVEFEAYEL